MDNPSERSSESSNHWKTVMLKGSEQQGKELVEHMEKNPLEDYGFAITSWLRLLKYLINLFFLFIFLAGGICYIYKDYGIGIKGGAYDSMSQLTLGNLGSSDPLCIQNPTDHVFERQRKIKCFRNSTLQSPSTVGLIDIHAIDNSTKGGNKSVGYGYCGNYHNISMDPCNQYFNQIKFREDWDQ